MKVGYHVSHEQFDPQSLLELVQLAESVGFQEALSSDHFHPWSRRQGQSGFAWAWLGAAMQATKIPFSIATAPVERYHPAIIAQAAATIVRMFPDRFTLSVGSGQLINEGITGKAWPAKDERNRRLKEAVDIIRALWTGETVNHRGAYHIVEEAKLYTLPSKAPMVIGTALTAETAEWLAGWADGLLTVSRPMPQLQKMLDAFYRGGGEGKPLFLKVDLSYAPSAQQAREGAWQQWRYNVFDSPVLSTLRTPDAFDAAARYVMPSDLDGYILISDSTAFFVERLHKFGELGFTHLLLHNVNTEQKKFIEEFGRNVLPRSASDTATWRQGFRSPEFYRSHS